MSSQFGRPHARNSRRADRRETETEDRLERNYEMTAAREDLELKQLGQFSGGSENLYRDIMFHTDETEGVKYVADNGYGWFISDAKAVLKGVPRVRNEEFVVVRLTVNPDKTATVTYDDGNNNVLYHQNYKWTSAKRDIKLYFENNVLMLPDER